VASWWEKADGRHKHKTFYVKEHGDNAKARAEEHRLEMERSARASVQKPAEHQSGVRGVTYDKKDHAWVAEWQEDGKKRKKSFSRNKYGDDEALQRAIDHRRAMESRHYTFVGKSSSRAARSGAARRR